MNERDLAEAAFWDRLVCLDCDQAVEGQAEPNEVGLTCPLCGKDAVYSAAFIQRIADFLSND